MVVDVFNFVGESRFFKTISLVISLRPHSSCQARFLQRDSRGGFVLRNNSAYWYCIECENYMHMIVLDGQSKDSMILLKGFSHNGFMCHFPLVSLQNDSIL